MTTPITQDRVAAFLAELSMVSRKHNIRIAGCGCCNSPYMVDNAGNGQYVVGHPMWSQVSWLDAVGNTHDGGTPVEIES